MDRPGMPGRDRRHWTATAMLITAVRANTGADRFETFVDRFAAAAAPRCKTFGQLVGALPGVVPDETLASLRRLSRGSRNWQHLDRLVADAKRDRAPAILNQGHGLPLPHPLDSEFRFDEETALRLTGALVAATRDGDEILLVGTPTVAMALAATPVDRRVRFVGPDDCVTAAVAAAFDPDHLVLGDSGVPSAAAALIDPPWYLGPVQTMLGVCARCCSIGAPVWMVVPPVGTKAEAEHDRQVFIGIARRLGLRTTSATATALYRTPLFELAAMERQGIARLGSWRRGDVVELVVQEARTLSDAPVREACELTIGGVRLRLAAMGGGGPPVLKPIVCGEVYPSVSSRAPGRSLANLWTSGNRAFVVNADCARAAMAELARMADRVLRGRLTVDRNDLDRLSAVAPSNRLIHQLIELLGRELDDARRLVGDGAWLETAMGWRS
jgi:hypothetical protein